MKSIKSIEIKNSPFFEDLKIQFDEKMNCIMGGRGTGKSTILFFLKSALCPDIQVGKINDILKNNLGNGEIIVEMQSNDGSLYRIVKIFNEEPQPYKLPNQDFISLLRIFEDIECDFYETNQIEEIGRSPIDRLKLIDKKNKVQLYIIFKELHKIQFSLDDNAQNIKSTTFRINQIKDSLLQYGNVEEEFQEFKSSEPINIQASEKDEFENADVNEKKRTDEKRFFNKTSSLYLDLHHQLKSFQDYLKDNFESAILNKENYLNKDKLYACIEQLSNNNNLINSKLIEIETLIDDSRKVLNSHHAEVIKTHEAQQADFVSLKQKFEKNRDYFTKYNILTNRLKEKETLQQEIVEIELKKSKKIQERILLIDKLNKFKDEIFSIRLSAVQEINEILGGDVKITLKFSGIVTEFENRLRDALKGSGLKYNDLINKIVTTFKPDQFAKTIQDKNIESLKLVSGIDELRANAIINNLFDSESIYKIESIYCDDLPDFKLKIEGDIQRDSYKNSDELSMGQRCTTVLPIIFAVSQNPLIIDQPEDNLDNKYISEKIHNIIKEQKDNRQLIFITHNPNIPVLADSEYNLFLNYENKESKKLKEGTVDTVKDDILKILEGGEKAFKIRKEKYNIDYEL